MQIGRQVWMQQSSGDLSLQDRVALLRHSLFPVLKQSLKMYSLAHRKSTSKFDLNLTDLQLPDSSDVQQALEKMQSCSSVALQNHCLRTWYFAAGFSKIQGLQPDDELLAVSCLLHDLGMTESYAHHQPNCRCFAGQGAYAAKGWAIERAWEIPRADQLFDAIAMHMNPYVAPIEGTEAHLLQQAASCDVIGSRGFEFSTQFRQQLQQCHPRLNFNQEMLEFIQKESAQRPKSRTAIVVQSGLKQMIKLNPYLN